MKTYDNAVSVDRKGKANATLPELAKRSGFATGDITTSDIQDATPAVQVSHISARSCDGPVATTKTCPEAAKENGGRGSISEQVTLGGGSRTFVGTATAGSWKGQTLEEQARARGYNYLTAKSDLAGVASADQKRPLLGLFAPGKPAGQVRPVARHGWWSQRSG